MRGQGSSSDFRDEQPRRFRRLSSAASFFLPPRALGDAGPAPPRPRASGPAAKPRPLPRAAPQPQQRWLGTGPSAARSPAAAAARLPPASASGDRLQRHETGTIGAAFVAKVMPVGGRTVTLGIWDTAGSERYEAMSRIYYRGAKAAIVCYDLTDSSSFQRAKFWVNELQNFEENCRIYLCGTKCDLLDEDRRRRGIDFHDVQDYADEIKAELFETSSKTGQNVDELFMKVAEDYAQLTAFHEMTEEKGVD
uniref:Ras-related protein Rab-24 n=1 Tax=Podarcis muralis TaxID=64176 RepID=A0A670IJH2_PODMU